MADRRVPVHLATLVGCSTAAYALSLAAITALQSASDAAVVADRLPLSERFDAISDAHDTMERQVAELADAYDRSVAAYAEFGPRFTRLESGLDAVAGTASSITNDVTSLPTRLSLPSVRAAARAAAPATHATTRASGG